MGYQKGHDSFSSLLAGVFQLFFDLRPIRGLFIFMNQYFDARPQGLREPCLLFVLSIRACVISTIRNFDLDEVVPTRFTMPEMFAWATTCLSQGY